MCRVVSSRVVQLLIHLLDCLCPAARRSLDEAEERANEGRKEVQGVAHCIVVVYYCSDCWLYSSLDHRAGREETPNQPIISYLSHSVGLSRARTPKTRKRQPPKIETDLTETRAASIRPPTTAMPVQSECPRMPWGKAGEGAAVGSERDQRDQREGERDTRGERRTTTTREKMLTSEADPYWVLRRCHGNRRDLRPVAPLGREGREEGEAQDRQVFGGIRRPEGLASTANPMAAASRGRENVSLDDSLLAHLLLNLEKLLVLLVFLSHGVRLVQELPAEEEEEEPGCDARVLLGEECWHGHAHEGREDGHEDQRADSAGEDSVCRKTSIV